jgi:hypothetical protein
MATSAAEKFKDTPLCGVSMQGAPPVFLVPRGLRPTFTDWMKDHSDDPVCVAALSDIEYLSRFGEVNEAELEALTE